MTANKLHYGDTIGIIAPCYVALEETYASFLVGLHKLGFVVKTGRNLYRSTYGYAASEQERADDFHDMVLDKEVKMILFGGGSVGNELLPYLDFDLIKSHPKLIVSYSDGTTLLNVFYAKTGVTTHYGQFPGVFGRLSEYDRQQFISHFMKGTANELTHGGPWKTVCSGVCEGILAGGYIRNFALLFGGCYFPYDKSKKYILFLEEYEKYGTQAEVSSYLAHIGQSTFMECVGGLLFGHYSDKVVSELSLLLERFGRRHHIPVVACDDFGHGTHHAILPIGCMARLDAESQTLHYSYI